MGYVFSVTNVAVSRAGANTIAELLNLKIPMLLIPLSKEVSRGDQIENAKYFKEKGYAKVLLSENLTPTNLLNEINELFQAKSEIMKIQETKNIDAKKLIMEQILKNIK